MSPATADGLDLVQLRQLYGVEGLNLSTIARRVGSDIDAVRLACQRAGMYRRHRGRLSFAEAGRMTSETPTTPTAVNRSGA